MDPVHETHRLIAGTLALGPVAIAGYVGIAPKSVGSAESEGSSYSEAVCDGTAKITHDKYNRGLNADEARACASEGQHLANINGTYYGTPVSVTLRKNKLGVTDIDAHDIGKMEK